MIEIVSGATHIAVPATGDDEVGAMGRMISTMPSCAAILSGNENPPVIVLSEIDVLISYMLLPEFLQIDPLTR
jgi:hypothetical protein